MSEKILVIGMCGNSLFYQKESKKLLHQEAGGKGYNQAVGIKKLGGDVTFVGAIGNDEHGKMCADYLDCIKMPYVLFKKEKPTTYATINVDKEGFNEIEVYKGAELEIKDLKKIFSLIENHDIILLQLEIPDQINEKIIEFASNKNKKIIVNPAPAKKFIRKKIDKFFLITPNEDEAKTLYGNIDELEKIIHQQKCSVLITLGSKGAVLIKDEIKYFPGMKVKAIDTTGAGDMMNACVCYQLANGATLEQAVEFGIIGSAISVSKPYVLDSYPTFEEIKKYLENKNVI